jgi:hypothetical protein
MKFKQEERKKGYDRGKDDDDDDDVMEEVV